MNDAEYIIFAGRETNLITDVFSPQTQIKALSHFLHQIPFKEGEKSPSLLNLYMATPNEFHLF